jgi:MFS family permease
MLFVQLYLKESGASTFVIGLAASLNAAGILIGSLVWGAACDRMRRKPLLVVTGIGFALAIGVLGFLPPAGVVLGSAFVRLFLFAGFGAVMMAIVSGVSSNARRGKNLSYVSSGRALGFAVGLITAGFLLERLGFRVGFAVIAVLPVVGMAFLATMPSETKGTRHRRQGAWRLALSAGLVDLYVGTVLRQMAIFGTFSLLFVYMDSIGIPPGTMGIVSSLNTLTQVVALILFGRLADRLGRRTIFMIGFALSVVTPCMFVLIPDVLGMALGYFTLGLSFSSLYIGSTAHIGDRVPQELQGTMLGLYESSRGLGGMFGPMIAGGLVPIVGFRGMFLAMAGIAVLGLLVMLLGGPTSKIVRARW